MDDININDINIHLEEIKLDSDKEWIKLNWTNRQNDTNDKASEIPDTQKEFSDNKTWETQTRDNNDEICTSTESGDTSDGISVISESDLQDISINSFHTCQLNDKTFKIRGRYITEEAVKMTIACLCGVMAGFLLHMIFMSTYYILPPNPFLNRISNQTLITTSHDIINTYKELAEVKIILSEIEVYTKATNHEISIKDRLMQILGSIKSNKRDNKSIIESSDSDLHPLNQLQLFLNVLSDIHIPVIKIKDINNLRKNKMNEALDIVNNVKAFYEALILFKNNTRNNFVTTKFLQNATGKIYNTSQLLLSDLLEKMNKATLNIYNRYTKLAHKLREKLCHLQNVLSDNNEFLKQLTENNQLIEDYNEFCVFFYSSKNLDKKITVERDTIKYNMKNRIEKSDHPVLYSKHDKTNTSKVHKNNSLLKDKNNEARDINSFTTKISKNASGKIHYTNKSPLSKKILPGNMNKDETENYIVISDKERNINIVTTGMDRKQVRHTTEKNERMRKDSLKSYVSINTAFNNDNADIGKGNYLQKNRKCYVSQKEVINYHKSNYSCIRETCTTQQNNYCMEKNSKKKRFCEDILQNNSDWFFLRRTSREHARKKISYKSDWYSQWAHSRKHARKYMKYQQYYSNWYFLRSNSRKNARKYMTYQQNINFRRKYP